MIARNGGEAIGKCGDSSGARGIIDCGDSFFLVRKRGECGAGNEFCGSERGE